MQSVAPFLSAISFLSIDALLAKQQASGLARSLLLDLNAADSTKHRAVLPLLPRATQFSVHSIPLCPLYITLSVSQMLAATTHYQLFLITVSLVTFLLC